MIHDDAARAAPSQRAMLVAALPWSRHDVTHAATECPTRGNFESMVEANIKSRAEGMHTAATSR